MDKKTAKRVAERRAFLKKAGTAAAAAPAAALLLSVEAKATDSVRDPYTIILDTF